MDRIRHYQMWRKVSLVFGKPSCVPPSTHDRSLLFVIKNGCLQAPEAGNILWENLELTNKQRARRKTLTLSITIVLLGVSFAVLYVSNIAERVFNSAGEYQTAVIEVREGEGGGSHRLVLTLSHLTISCRIHEG